METPHFSILLLKFEQYTSSLERQARNVDEFRAQFEARMSKFEIHDYKQHNSAN
jgi:hypothetical protein